jgi:hypothetical protein
MGDINTTGREEYRRHIRENASTDDTHYDDDRLQKSPAEELVVPGEPIAENRNAPLTPIPASPFSAPVISPDVGLLQLPAPALSPESRPPSELGSSPRSPTSGISPKSPRLAGHTSGSSRASSPVPETPPQPSSFWKRLTKGGKSSKREKMVEAMSGLLERTASRGSAFGRPAPNTQLAKDYTNTYRLAYRKI